MYNNSSQTVLILENVSAYIYRITFPPLVILGLIGHILNIILFTRPNLISNSCCNYCLASSCVNIIQILLGQLFRLLKGGFHIAIATLWFCRLRIFFLYTAYLASSTLITLASIDRYVSSSHQVKYRRWADVNIARRLIPIVFIVTGLCQSHILFLFVIDIIPDNECWAPKGTPYRICFDIIFLIFHGLTVPILMSTFGFLTIYNIRQQRCAHQLNIISKLRRHRIRDFQQMILVQTICIVTFTLPFAAHKLHRTLTRFDWKSSEQRAWEKVSMGIVRLLWFFHESAAFYIYSLASITFRRELFTFLNEYRRQTRTTVPLELFIGKPEEMTPEPEIE